jgi:hypothetical protein
LTSEGIFPSWPLPCKINQKHPQGFGDQSFALLSLAHSSASAKYRRPIPPHMASIFWLISPEADLLSLKKETLKYTLSAVNERLIKQVYLNRSSI